MVQECPGSLRIDADSAQLIVGGPKAMRNKHKEKRMAQAWGSPGRSPFHGRSLIETILQLYKNCSYQ